MQIKPTIQHIARQAGVSVTTVSRVLNAHPNVRPSTRARVERVIEAADYRPNFAARSMRTQKTQVIAFVTDEIATTPFAVRTVEGAQRLAWEHGKLLFVVNTSGDASLEGAVLENLLERQVEGVVYAALYHRRVEPPALLRELPTVLIDCFTDDASFTSVVPDEVQAGFTATKTLLEEGHRRVALLNLRRGTVAAEQRQAGYEEALAAHGVAFDPNLVRYGDWTAHGGYVRTLEVMKLSEPPTAIFCANDRTAMGVYDALRDLQLRIPDDVSVIGFDDQEVIAAYLRPALTTMALPHFEMGRWAVNALLRPGRTPVQARLECPLVPRASVSGRREGRSAVT